MITLDDVQAARDRIRQYLRDTPCWRSPRLSQECDADVWCKFDNLQVSGAFKERGAANKILCLSDEEKARGVIAASAGNHAQGVAYHAGRLGLQATIVMPTTTPGIKVENTRSYGAEVVLAGENYDEAYKEARHLQQEKGLTFIHPFDDDEVMAGQGTLGLEMLEAVPDLDAVIVPVGGGGLIAGISTAIKALRPQAKVFGVQSALQPSMRASLQAGQRVTLESKRTIADGIRVTCPGAKTFEVVRERVDDVRTVSEEELASAILYLLEREKVVTEGAGAAGVAAVRAGRFPELRGKKVVALVCGGNIDLHQLSMVLERSQVQEQRLVRLAVRVDDKPGGLAKFLLAVAEQGGNVIQIQHNRAFGDSPLWQADVDVTLETRDRQHAESLIRNLKEGFEVTTF